MLTLHFTVPCERELLDHIKASLTRFVALYALERHPPGEEGDLRAVEGFGYQRSPRPRPPPPPPPRWLRKQSEQKTSRLPLGRNGTLVSWPQEAQTASNISRFPLGLPPPPRPPAGCPPPRAPPPCRPPPVLRASRQGLHRLGSLSKPLDA